MIVRCPIRSPAMPKAGASKVPRYCNAQYRVSARTEPVVTRMYQPSTKFSISMPQEVRRSAGNWNRKLRTWNGASIADHDISFMRRAASRRANQRPHQMVVVGGIEPAVATLAGQRPADQDQRRSGEAGRF